MEDNLALNCQNKEMINNQTPTNAPFVNGHYRGRLAKDKPRITSCQLVSHLVNFKGFTRSSKYCYKADDGGRAGQKYHKDWTSDCTGDSHSKQKKLLQILINDMCDPNSSYALSQGYEVLSKLFNIQNMCGFAEFPLASLSLSLLLR